MKIKGKWSTKQFLTSGNVKAYEIGVYHIVMLYNQGVTSKVVAKDLNIAEDTVIGIFKRLIKLNLAELIK